MSRPAPSSVATSDSEAHMRSDPSPSSSDSGADAPRRIEIRRRKREFRRWLQRRGKFLRREHAENVAQQYRESLEAATQAELCPATVCVTSELGRAVEERTRE